MNTQYNKSIKPNLVLIKYRTGYRIVLFKNGIWYLSQSCYPLSLVSKVAGQILSFQFI